MKKMKLKVLSRKKFRSFIIKGNIILEHEMVVETQEVVEHEEEVETEEMSNSMNEEMEQIMTEDLANETKSKPSSVPPLRPLTIAPKPAKIPLAVKPTSGQQLFLVQG